MLGVYFHQCAIAMSCRQLATAARFLAHNGRNPNTGHSVVSVERARRITHNSTQVNHCINVPASPNHRLHVAEIAHVELEIGLLQQVADTLVAVKQAVENPDAIIARQ